MVEVGLLDAAVGEFGRRLCAVRAVQWDLPTPCTAWSVRDLVAHVVDGNILAIRLLTGGRGGDGRRSIDAVGPAAEYHRTVGEQRAAFEAAEASAEVDHPAARVTADRFVIYRAADIAVHAWDLARAIGADEQLGDELVEQALAPYVDWVATLPTGDMFRAGSGGAATGRRQDRLLDRLGRRP